MAGQLSPARPSSPQRFKGEELKGLVHPRWPLIDVKYDNPYGLANSGLVGGTYSEVRLRKEEDRPNDGSTFRFHISLIRVECRIRAHGVPSSRHYRIG
jgi:hypothetical protein